MRAGHRWPVGSGAGALGGSGSVDPDGEIVLYRWSEEGTVLVSGVEPFATVTLPVGSHTLRLDVTDDCNRTASDSVVVTIGGPAPSEMISALVDAVIGYRLDPGIEASLLPKLDGALAALTAEPPSKAAAIGKLRAFVTECEALRGRRLPPEAADRLAREARCVILALRS